MPYIHPESRRVLNPYIKGLADHISESKRNRAGEVVYAIYTLILTVYKDANTFDEKADVLKILDSAKGEYRRRHLNVYEDLKIAENGDCFPL